MLTGRGTHLVAAALALGGAGCDALRVPGPFPRQEPPGFVVEVWHNAPVAASLSIFVLGPDGVLERLGRVGPSRTETFEVPGPLSGGDYRLVAESADGRRLVSPPFSVLAADGVQWDVDRNRILALWRSER